MDYLGTPTGGRWFPTEQLKEGMILFSFGVGEDISFELECLKRGVEVYCFDPTPKSEKYIRALDNPKINFYRFGIWNADMAINFYYPAKDDEVSCSIVTVKNPQFFVGQVYTLTTIINNIGCQPDILKLDIEGAEDQVLYYARAANLLPPVLMVEFHANQSLLIGALMGHYDQCYRNNKDYLFL